MQIILLYMVLFIVPFLMGQLYHNLTNEEVGIITNWFVGFVFILGLLLFVALPCVFLKTSLDFLTIVYSLLLVGACVCSVKLNYTKYSFSVKNVITNMCKSPFSILVMIVVIAFQMYNYIAYRHADADDSFFVALAVTAVDTNTLFEYSPYTGDVYQYLMTRYVFSPFFVFPAILSNVFGIHPTILAHTILPPVYLLMAYVVVGMLGYEFYNKNVRKTTTLVAVTAIITMYFYTSIRTQGSFMLLRIWQGKAFLAAVLLPFVFYLGYKIFIGKWSDKAWILAFFTMSACCLVSSMGIMLGAISFGIVGIICASCKKDIKILINSIICCAPNVVLAIAYLLCG